MKGLDAHIMGLHDPNAPFNQIDIDEQWQNTLNALNISDEEYEKMMEENEIDGELTLAYERVISSKFKDFEKLYAKEIAKEFLQIRNLRLFKNEIDD